jgi:hypothetical protein
MTTEQQKLVPSKEEKPQESLEEYVRKRNQFKTKEEIPVGRMRAEFLCMLPGPKNWKMEHNTPNSYFHFFMNVNNIEFCPGFLSPQKPTEGNLLYHLCTVMMRKRPSDGIVSDLSCYKGFTLEIQVVPNYARKGNYFYPKVVGVYELSKDKIKVNK